MPSVKFEIRTATPEDIPALRQNWSASFGDTDEYLDFFFHRRFDCENTLVACVGKSPAAQLFLLPAKLRSGESELCVDYLFAAATHPKYRKQGIMSTLLSYARTLCAERGKDAIVLLPGSPSLYNYYAQRGYEKAFSRRRWVVTRDELACLRSPVKETADVLSVLQSVLNGRDGLCWDADALAYALEEHRLFRGAYAASEHAFVSFGEDEAVCLCTPEDFGECAALLLGLSDLPQFTLTFPSDIPNGIWEDGGMLCCLCNNEIHLRDAYISFAME